MGDLASDTLWRRSPEVTGRAREAAPSAAVIATAWVGLVLRQVAGVALSVAGS